MRLGISLDGSTPKIHDAFRGWSGAWERTIQAIEWANEARHSDPGAHHHQPPQRTRSRHPAQPVRKACHCNVERLFPGPGGPRAAWDLLSGQEFEQVFAKIHEPSHRVNFQIKTTDAMHYRRYLLQRNLKQRRIGHGHPHAGVSAYEAGAPTKEARTRNRLGDPPGQRR